MPVIIYTAYKKVIKKKNYRENRKGKGVWSRAGDAGVTESVLDRGQGKPYLVDESKPGGLEGGAQWLGRRMFLAEAKKIANVLRQEHEWLLRKEPGGQHGWKAASKGR